MPHITVELASLTVKANIIDVVATVEPSAGPLVIVTVGVLELPLDTVVLVPVVPVLVVAAAGSKANVRMLLAALLPEPNWCSFICTVTVLAERG